jgi:N-acetylglutamate synthase-like GNAT family acetyltransferase
MHFRKALITDIPTIQHIAEETWWPTYGHILTEEQTLYMLDMMYAEEVLRKQIEGNVDFFMVEESGVAVGYFAIEQMEEKHAKLHKIYLSSKKKSAGIGSAIIQFLKKWGLERGIQTIELNVNKYNSAVTFYEKMGFERLREMVLDIGQGYVMDDYVMQLRLLPIR